MCTSVSRDCKHEGGVRLAASGCAPAVHVHAVCFKRVDKVVSAHLNRQLTAAFPHGFHSRSGRGGGRAGTLGKGELRAQRSPIEVDRKEVVVPAETAVR